MKRNILFFSFALLLSKAVCSQEISVYHGTPGQSVIFLKKKNPNYSGWKDSSVFIRERGEKIEIVVLNPNPFFYTYELKIDEFEIKEEAPDITDLLSAINAIPDLAQKVTENSKLFMPRGGGGGGRTPMQRYQDVLQDISGEISLAKQYILASDLPENKSDALTASSSAAGYRNAVLLISMLSSAKGHFNSSTLEEDLNSMTTPALADASIVTNVAPADQDRVKEVYNEAFKLLNKQMAETVKAIKKACEADPVIRFEVPVTDKNLKVRLVAKKKEGHKDKKRMEFEKLICVIVPEFERKKLEIVPLICLTYAKDIPEFGIKNGVITKGTDPGLRFRVGAMVLYNFLHFGKYKEGAFGAGLAYCVPKKDVLESFSIGTLLSYKNTFRVGIGAGYSSYPYRLLNDLQPGNPLPADIKNLEDVVEYRKKLSFFINFSISGITVLKK